MGFTFFLIKKVTKKSWLLTIGKAVPHAKTGFIEHFMVHQELLLFDFLIQVSCF